MKSRESAVRLKRFEAEEKARKVEDLEAMIRDFDQMAIDLERQITSEEERSGIKDPAHYAYSTFAKAAAQRHANLAASVGDLRAKLEAATKERDAVLEDLAKAEATENRDCDRGRRKPERTRGETVS